MDKKLYDMIFKRKSFHLFRGIGNLNITNEEIEIINKKILELIPLDKDIKTKIFISKDGASCHRGQEYEILFYSEKKDNYLQNIGYLGEQLDLFLATLNIGSLWFGIGKPKEEIVDGLNYVIMMAIAKVDDPKKFRSDMFKSKRKDLDVIWVNHGDNKYHDIVNICRFAPSACNSQPWIIETKDKEIMVSRYHNMKKRGIMPKDKVSFYNQIDIGILLCFLELSLDHENISYDRIVYLELDHDGEMNLTAKYNIK